jgi:colanic acid/amylovoran biosynthesis glycosyltransferase
MKVLLYSHSFGGITTTFIYNEIIGLIEKGHQVLFVCNELSQSENSNIIGCEIKHIPFTPNKIRRKIQWNLWKKDKRILEKDKKFSKELNDTIDHFQPDIIHNHFAYEGIRLYQNLSSVNNKIPMIFHFHGYGASEMLKKNSYVREISSILSNKNCFSIHVSDLMKETLSKYEIPLERSILLRYGIDLDLFKSQDPPEEGKIVFTQISSLVEKKGHKYTCQAFNLFFQKHKGMKSKIKIQFSGEGESLNELKSLIEALEMKDNVTFLGNISHKECIKVLSKSNFFLHHSVIAENGDMEGIPNAIMEAMAMKLPVLSTFHAGIPELVEHGVNGFLCEEKDIEKYSFQIEEILAWKKLEINREKVAQFYNFKNHNDQLESFYFNLINS